MNSPLFVIIKSNPKKEFVTKSRDFNPLDIQRITST